MCVFNSPGIFSGSFFLLQPVASFCVVEASVTFELKVEGDCREKQYYLVPGTDSFEYFAKIFLDSNKCRVGLSSKC